MSPESANAGNRKIFYEMRGAAPGQVGFLFREMDEYCEVIAGGSMKDGEPRGFLTGLVVSGTVRKRTLWEPRVFGGGIVTAETGRGAGLSLAWTRTLRGPSVGFPTPLVTSTEGLGNLPIVVD